MRGVPLYRQELFCNHGRRFAGPLVAGVPQAHQAPRHPAPKFYCADVGVVNRLAQRGEPKSQSALYGKAFENWAFHELSAYLSYRRVALPLTYWRLSSGIEADFVAGDRQLAIDAKATEFISGKP